MRQTHQPHRDNNATRRRHAQATEGDVRDLLLQRGMTLRVSVMTLGRRKKTETFHWMIEADGRRVVDFWPVSGTWRCGTTGESGKIHDPLLIVEIASKLASGG